MIILNSIDPWWTAEQSSCSSCGLEVELEATDNPITSVSYNEPGVPENAPTPNTRQSKRHRATFRCPRCRGDILVQVIETPSNNKGR